MSQLVWILFLSMILWGVYCFYYQVLLLQRLWNANSKINWLLLDVALFFNWFMSWCTLVEYDDLHYLLKILSIGFLVLDNMVIDLLSVVPSIWWILRLMSSSMHCWYRLVEHRFFWTNGCRFLIYKKLNSVTLLQEWTYFVRFSVNMCIFVCA